MLKVLKLNDYSDIKLPHWPQVLFGSNKVPTSHQHQHVFGPEHALMQDAKSSQQEKKKKYIRYIPRDADGAVSDILDQATPI